MDLTHLGLVPLAWDTKKFGVAFIGPSLDRKEANRKVVSPMHRGRKVTEASGYSARWFAEIPRVISAIESGHVHAQGISNRL